MKKAGMVIVLLIVVAAILISGCSTQKTTLRVDNRFFAPIKTMAQKKALPPKASLTTNSLQRELAARTTEVDLLKKENLRLRERVARLEKQLAITNSSNKVVAQDNKKSKAVGI